MLMARVAVQRAEADSPNDFMRWLDRSLIRLTSKFADYEKEKPHTLQMHQEFSIYPQFMFHLRRSPFLADFNSVRLRSVDRVCVHFCLASAMLLSVAFVFCVILETV